MKIGYWQPSGGIQASLALHAGAGAALLAGAPWGWPLGTLVANHVLLTAAGLWPRSHLLGANLTRLPDAHARNAVALTIDDGPDPEVTPQVLDLLDAAHARASFFCIGQRVEQHPQLAREIVARGHRIENHSHTHAHHFSFLGMGGLRREIVRAQQAISQVTGQSPVYFRAPAGLRNPLLDPVLQGLGLQLASWTRRGFDTVTPDADRVMSRLSEGLQSGDVLLLHDGHSPRLASGQTLVLVVLPRLLALLHERGLRAVALPRESATMDPLRAAHS
jgi:peptidoglycan-N-acetylglucosamine deacetylase